MREIRLLRDLHAELALRDRLDALWVLELRNLHIETLILLLDAGGLALRLHERVAAARTDAAANRHEHREQRRDEDERRVIFLEL